jgi:hypothetical protein
MKDLGVVRMVYVGEDTEELAVYVFGGWREGRGKFVAWFCWEGGFVVEEVLDPGHYVVDVSWRWELHASVICIFPCVV